MRKGYQYRAREVVKQSDLLLEVLDARFPQQSRNKEMEEHAVREGKKILLVLNKSDLVSKNKAEKFKKELEEEFPCVFVSAKERKGINRLRQKISEIGKGRIGVIGYPNTGKSSVINALKGRKTAPISIKAGFTKGQQYVKLNEKILLIDSPGVIPFKERDEFFLALIGAKNPEQLKDTEATALKLLEMLGEKEPEKRLEEIALEKKKLLKKGIPDTKAASKILLQQWQKGKIKA